MSEFRDDSLGGAMEIGNDRGVLANWEIGLVKAMLDRGQWNDQQILAYFTRPTRSVNHRAIGEIRKGKRGKAIEAATKDELDRFLLTWPEVDPQTGLSILGDELLIKAREAMIAAVHTFNGAGLYFRTEIFIVTAMIAWTYLFHAYFKSKGIDYRYYTGGGKEKTLQLTPSGAEKYWDLSQCINSSHCPIDGGTKANLVFLLELRHEIEHRMTSRIDDAVSAKLQACAINFNATIKAKFGLQYGLERRLPIALQFVVFSADQRNLIKATSNLPSNVITMVDSFHGRMTAEEQGDPHFAYRVAFVPKMVNRAATADEAIEFIKANSETAEALNQVLFKETEKKKYGAKQIVSMMQKEGFTKFNLHRNSELWRSLDAKNPSKGFGVEILGGVWCWYETWVSKVRQHCEENAALYGKAGENA